MSAGVASAGALAVLRRGIAASPELRRGAGVTVLLALVGAGGRVAVPVAVQQVLDRGLREGGVRLGTVWALVGAAAAVLLVTTICVQVTHRRLAVASERALCGLRSRAFAHIHRLAMADHSDSHRGALVSRVTSDVETLSQFFSWGGVAWVVNGAVMVATVVTMVVYDVRLALVAVTVVFPLAVVLRVLQRHLVAAYDVVRTRVAELLTAVSETVMGAAVVRAYGIEERTTARVVGAIDGERHARVRAARISALLFPSGEVFSVLTVAAVVVAGVALGPDAGLSAGEVVAFVFLVNLFLEPVAEFTEILDQTQTAVAGWRKVLDVLDTPIEVVEPDPGYTLPPTAPEIVVDHVSFAYRPSRLQGLEASAVDPLAPPAGTAVLRDVSLRIEPATRVALVGATGSGKTTLAKLLIRLADPTEGRIVVSGIDLRDVATPSLRTSLVMVPQDGFLFDDTVAENVRFGRRDAGDDDVGLAFVELGLLPWVESLPQGIHTPVGQRGEQLSVGERQLVALARAYLANPVCLILDEATSAVDPGTETRLTRALESLSRGRTSVTIAHRLATAETADLIVVMDEGRVAEQGSHAELLARGGVYAGLYDSWLDGTAAAASATRS